MPLAVDPNIAAIIRYGKKHPQYNRAVRIYEQQKYQYDLGQQKEHSQAVARAELQRRALSGELDDKHPFFWSKAESDAMAPILAKRKAEAKQAEDQRRKEIGQKNPYKLQLEDAKTGIEGLESVNLGNGSTEYFKNEGGRRVKVNPSRDKGFDNEYFRQKSIADGSYGSGLAIPQELRDQAKRYVAYKDKQRDGIASKAELIDSVNDPYNRIQADRAREQHATLKEQYALQKDTQAKRDAAAAEIAKEYMESPSKYEMNHGGPAAAAADKIARAHLGQKYSKAGYDGVPLGGMIFDPNNKMGSQGTTTATGQAQGASSSGSSTAATGQSATSSSSTTSGARSGSSASQQSTPSAPATPQGPTYDPSKKYDHIKHAQWFETLPEAEKKQQLATMDDFQKNFLRESIAAVKKYEPAFKSVEDAKNSAPSMWGVAADNIGKTYQAIKGDVADIPQNMAKSLWDGNPSEKASQAVQSVVTPQRSNEPSPDWKPITDAVGGPLRKAYDVTSQFVNGPTAPIVNALSKPLVRGVSKAFDWAGDPYGLAGREDSTPQAEQPVPQQEDEKDPAVIARRLLNTPSSQF